MEVFDNHKNLFWTACLFFLGLTIAVAILPAINNQKNNEPLPGATPLTQEALIGKNIFISNGCVACHTQQVRNVAMDNSWGDRPGIAADYAGNRRTDWLRNTATLMGTERTGPDLTNVGKRQPGKEWHLLHLFNPRAVVRESIMPAYPWLFEIKKHPGKGDVKINVPEAFSENINGSIVASQDAMYLIAYLQSLVQTKLPDGNTPAFLYKSEQANNIPGSPKAGLDGKLIYSANCQSCHQPNGEGLKGAFPPLKGSPVVMGENLEKYVDIIMNGYDAREEFGVMPPVGTNMKFTQDQLAALINHERSSWGNTGKKVSPEEIKKIMDIVKRKSAK